MFPLSDDARKCAARHGAACVPPPTQTRREAQTSPATLPGKIWRFAQWFQSAAGRTPLHDNITSASRSENPHVGRLDGNWADSREIDSAVVIRLGGRPKDGYTWAAGAAQDLGAYQSLGMLNVSIKDWHLFLNVANIAVVGVNPATPYQNVKDLLDAMKAKPGQIKVATAGVTSGGHNAMEAIARATGVTYRHVTYDGGNPAVVATVSGETDITTQLAVEQAEMIRGKRIRPLATVSDRPLEIEGFGVIEPISKMIPGFKAPANYFGVFIPKGVPPEVVATVEKIWAANIANNEALKKYATSRGALFAPSAGEAAQVAAFPAVQANVWLLHSGGKTKVSPDTVGIAKP